MQWRLSAKHFSKEQLTKGLRSFNGFSGAQYGHDLCEGDQVVAGFKEGVASTEQRQQDYTSWPHVNCW